LILTPPLFLATISRNMSWENAAVKHDLFGLQRSHDFTANIYISTVNIPNLETHSYWAGD
jgi:hypothetical protein